MLREIGCSRSDAMQYAFVCDKRAMAHMDKAQGTTQIANRSKDNIESIFSSCYSFIERVLLSLLSLPIVDHCKELLQSTQPAAAPPERSFEINQCNRITVAWNLLTLHIHTNFRHHSHLIWCTSTMRAAAATTENRMQFIQIISLCWMSAELLCRTDTMYLPSLLYQSSYRSVIVRLLHRAACCIGGYGEVEILEKAALFGLESHNFIVLNVERPIDIPRS